MYSCLTKIKCNFSKDYSFLKFGFWHLPLKSDILKINLNLTRTKNSMLSPAIPNLFKAPLL